VEERATQYGGGGTAASPVAVAVTSSWGWWAVGVLSDNSVRRRISTGGGRSAAVRPRMAGGMTSGAERVEGERCPSRRRNGYHVAGDEGRSFCNLQKLKTYEL
jgi:hypothetical protein